MARANALANHKIPVTARTAATTFDFDFDFDEAADMRGKVVEGAT